MSELDENQIKHQLEQLSGLQPSQSAAQRAIGKTRQALLNDQEIEQDEKSVIWHAFIKSPFIKLAAAAVIIVSIGLFIILNSPDESIETPIISQAEESPAQLLTFASLNMAHRRGGLDAVEKQCDRAFMLLGPRPKSLSITELLQELNRNGNNSERNKL
ncbi:MAG: hypothetical protein ACYSYW_03285 [Planctomycetota bacterium]|jgi:hypothetical protein